MTREATAWPLRLRLLVWIGIALCWWLETSSLANQVAACAAEQERVRALERVLDALASTRELEAELPDGESQDAAWWERQVEELVHTHRLDLAGLVVNATSDAIGAFRLQRLSFTATGSYADLTALVAEVEARKPRARLVSASVAPAAQGRVTAAITLLVASRTGEAR